MCNFLNKRHYRYLMITNEKLPVYHDRFQTTNKSIILVEKQKVVSNSSAVLVEGRVYSDTFNEIKYKYKEVHSSVELECQNGKPVQVYKNFKRHTGDPNFELNGFKQGDIFTIKSLGYLGDIDVIERVFLVTDRCVFTKGVIDKRVTCYKNEELLRMKEYDALKII